MKDEEVNLFSSFILHPSSFQSGWHQQFSAESLVSSTNQRITYGGFTMTFWLIVTTLLTGMPLFAAAPESHAQLKADLVAKHGESQRQRISKGIDQVAQYWRPEDGDARAFETFVRDHFVADQKTLDELFNRLEYTLEQLDGHMLEIGREFRR
jgi:hypothetical protein